MLHIIPVLPAGATYPPIENERFIILNALEVASVQWAQALATAQDGDEEVYARTRFEQIDRVLERWKT